VESHNCICLLWNIYYPSLHASHDRYVPFDPYRKFGFALWDEKMMVDLRFWTRWGLIDASDYCHTRRCILSEDEVTQASGIQKETW
jgi:hypothetical protein